MQSLTNSLERADGLSRSRSDLDGTTKANRPGDNPRDRLVSGRFAQFPGSVA